jgi:serine/threonine protein kinase/formylglycine-generating enzyme required for sulfatase activity
MSTDTLDWLGKAVANGRYSVTEKLGEGGMGYVYRAFDQNLDTDVVIKVPRRALLDDPEFAQRFSLEIRSLVKLQHPHIVKVTDVGEHDGLPFAVMQYLSSGDLTDRQPKGPNGELQPLPPQDIVSWLPAVAKAIDFVHGQNYIHRDVKPANILFDSHGNVYLSDFGVAKVIAENSETAEKLTGTGMVMGTPEYMSPELVMGEQVDGRVDQYALAVLVHELLCGEVPFTGPTPAAILVNQTTQQAVPLFERCPSIPQNVSDAVMKALAKEPNDRYVDCSSFAQAVVEAISAQTFSVEASAVTSPQVTGNTTASADAIKATARHMGHTAANAVRSFVFGKPGSTGAAQPSSATRLTAGLRITLVVLGALLVLTAFLAALRYALMKWSELLVFLSYITVWQWCAMFAALATVVFVLQRWLQRSARRRAQQQQTAEPTGVPVRRRLSAKKPLAIATCVAIVGAAGVLIVLTVQDKSQVNEPNPPISSSGPRSSPKIKPAFGRFLNHPPLTDGDETDSDRDEPKKTAKKPVTLTKQEKLEAIPLAQHDPKYDFSNSLGVRMVCIKPGRFRAAGRKGTGHSDWSYIKKPFWIAECEVTVAQYFIFFQAQNSSTSPNPEWLRTSSSGKDEIAGSEYYLQMEKDLYRNGAPIVGIERSDATRFCEWLSEQRGEESVHYRLPTDEEWTCAYRGGKETRFYWGDRFNSRQGNEAIDEDLYKFLAITGKYHESHPWKLSDMAGNVWEMTQASRSARGGAWDSTNEDDLSAIVKMTDRPPQPNIGFRVVAESKNLTGKK